MKTPPPTGYPDPSIGGGGGGGARIKWNDPLIIGIGELQSMLPVQASNNKSRDMFIFQTTSDQLPLCLFVRLSCDFLSSQPSRSS